MARTITFDSYNRNTGDVVFTIAGAAVALLNRTYTVNNLPTNSKEDLLNAIRAYLKGYVAGLQTVRPAADASVTAIVGQPQTDTEN